MAGGGVRGICLARKSSARTFLTPQPHGNIPPYAGNSHMGLRVAGPPRDWEVHSRLPVSGGGGSPTFFSTPPPPDISLSRQKGPVRHVVDLPATMRAPPPF